MSGYVGLVAFCTQISQMFEAAYQWCRAAIILSGSRCFASSSESRKETYRLIKPGNIEKHEYPCRRVIVHNTGPKQRNRHCVCKIYSTLVHTQTKLHVHANTAGSSVVSIQLPNSYYTPDRWQGVNAEAALDLMSDVL